MLSRAALAVHAQPLLQRFSVFCSQAAARLLAGARRRARAQLQNRRALALQAACLARCNGARVELYPFGSVGLEQFRAMVAEACSTADEHIIVSYSRKEFLQTGGRAWLPRSAQGACHGTAGGTAAGPQSLAPLPGALVTYHRPLPVPQATATSAPLAATTRGRTWC